MTTYAGESIRTVGLSADGKTLTLLGQTKVYPFPYEGAPFVGDQSAGFKLVADAIAAQTAALTADDQKLLAAVTPDTPIPKPA